MLYFDHCASTPPYDAVIDTVVKVMKQYYGNPSSIHQMGADAERLIHKARAAIAASLNIQPNEIVFTSGGTESNNLAIKGTAYEYRKRGNHLITTVIEHSSVYECFQQLEKEGFRVTYLPVDEEGRIRIKELEQALTDQTILVSIMHVNNEMGAIQPIKLAGQLLKGYPRINFHVDAIQSIGKVEIDPFAWGIDFMSLSAHKIRGPKGTGLLYCREGMKLHPLLTGGGQEQGMRSGTENVPFIAAMAKAIRMMKENLTKDIVQLQLLQHRLLTGIANIPQLILNSTSEFRAPHIINVSFPGSKSEVIVHALEERGIIISTKSACSSGESRPSRVLKAMGCNHQRSISGLRISLSPQHTADDIDYLCEQLKQVVEKFEK